MSVFPELRLRRLRSHKQLRRMIRETSLAPDDFIAPLFIRHGDNNRVPIASMPGQFQITVDLLADEIDELVELGIPAVILFGIPESKDEQGAEALSDEGIIPHAIRAIRERTDQLLVITDLCFCEYTDHGHCGTLHEVDGVMEVDNDPTLEDLAAQAVVHAKAGAHVIAPSGMMDGMVQGIRHGLDDAGFSRIPILSYAAKFSSAFYGPFRDAAESAPQFGDRKTYQMDPANGAEAMREVQMDVDEGADMLMVKPAMSYLDVISRVKDSWPEIPLCAYNVSGEYSMIKAAADNGWIDERKVALELLTSIKRAGADMIITYFARDAAAWLQQEND